MIKHYPVRLVGEQYYQRQVEQTRVGDIVDVRFEDGNPHDPKAIVVLSRGDASGPLGYIASDSFVQRLYHEERRCLGAAIKEIRVGSRGFLEVTLYASIVDFPAARIAFDPTAAGEWAPPKPVEERIAPAQKFANLPSGVPEIAIYVLILLVLLSYCST